MSVVPDGNADAVSDRSVNAASNQTLNVASDQGVKAASDQSVKAASNQSVNVASDQSVKAAPGEKFRRAIETAPPLQIAGTINAYCALLAEHAGFRALYLSGAGVSNASFGLPDLGMTSLNDVLEETRRITAATSLPLLVDADTGWGGVLSIARTSKELERAGAAGLHIEDQSEAKRCGHRPNKAIVSSAAMCERVKAAVDGRSDPSFVIMARTDAYANEGFEAALERCAAYVAAGADMVFPEALGSLQDYRRFVSAIDVPVLANLTEFGLTPAFTRAELAATGIAMLLYPLSAFRAMSKAAERVYTAIITDGTQARVMDSMQTRDELYARLGYYSYEQRVDALRGERDSAADPLPAPQPNSRSREPHG